MLPAQIPLTLEHLFPLGQLKCEKDRLTAVSFLCAWRILRPPSRRVSESSCHSGPVALREATNAIRITMNDRRFMVILCHNRLRIFPSLLHLLFRQ
jgi:hypothetical protein